MSEDERPTWILIADGHRARLLEQGPDSLTEVETWAYQRPAQASGHDDRQRREQRQFAHQVARQVDLHADQFRALILVAAPKTLGDLREGLADMTRRKVKLEVKGDWTQMPLHELPAHLARALLAR